MKYPSIYLQSNYMRILDLIISLPFLIVPLLIDLPYRVNIFLSWEGAYRLLIGQIPYVDFGLPMGFGYWLIPALFFKFFGPELATLVKAQIFINSISLLSVRGILYKLKVKPLVSSLALLIFCLTYVIYNFWPWYNHTVVVFELAGFYCLVHYTPEDQLSPTIGWVILGAFFTFLAFFTKQDAGAIAFTIGLALLCYYYLARKELLPVLTYLVSFIIIGSISILPFIRDGFLYWFNYGQPPHNPRLDPILLIDVFFSDKALWEKLYLSIILLLIISTDKLRLKLYFGDHRFVMLLIITIGLIGQAMITRVTSPLPTDHMTYFHAFAITLILILGNKLYAVIETPRMFGIIGLVMVLIFSTGYWKYAKGVLGMNISKEDKLIPRREEPWIEAGKAGFEGILLPKETLQGINELLQSDIAQKKHLKVLNMTELTPLALELDYTPPTDQPLWYHLNIGIFQKEVEMLCDRVKEEKYDLVLFQDIPGLIDFFPYQVRDTLMNYYHLQDRFLAPRKKENSFIEVYVKKKRKRGISNDGQI